MLYYIVLFYTVILTAKSYMFNLLYKCSWVSRKAIKCIILLLMRRLRQTIEADILSGVYNFNLQIFNAVRFTVGH